MCARFGLASLPAQSPAKSWSLNRHEGLSCRNNARHPRRCVAPSRRVGPVYRANASHPTFSPCETCYALLKRVCEEGMSGRKLYSTDISHKEWVSVGSALDVGDRRYPIMGISLTRSVSYVVPCKTSAEHIRRAFIPSHRSVKSELPQ